MSDVQLEHDLKSTINSNLKDLESSLNTSILITYNLSDKNYFDAFFLSGYSISDFDDVRLPNFELFVNMKLPIIIKTWRILDSNGLIKDIIFDDYELYFINQYVKYYQMYFRNNFDQYDDANENLKLLFLNYKSNTNNNIKSNFQLYSIELSLLKLMKYIENTNFTNLSEIDHVRTLQSAIYLFLDVTEFDKNYFSNIDTGVDSLLYCNN